MTSSYDSEAARLHCRCCGANLAREGHLPSCENNEPEDEYDEYDDEGGPDFDPYAGMVIFDDGGGEGW